MDRAILGHYERLNKAIADGANESAFADIQEQIREKEQRVSEIVDEMTAVSNLLIEESDVRDALGRFDEVWTALSPAERTKAIHQIVDSIQYDGHSKELSISYHPIGIRTFNQEQQSKEGAATSPRTERSLQRVSERFFKKCHLGNGFRLSCLLR